MVKNYTCYDIDGTLTIEMIFAPLIKSEYSYKLIGQETYSELGTILVRHKNGLVEYEDAVQLLLEAHARGLTGRNKHEVDTHATEFIHQNSELFRPFTQQVINLLKDHSTQIAVTAEPAYIAEAVMKSLGLDGAISTEYEIHEGVYTGKIKTSLADRHSKRSALNKLQIIYAFGDSEGDIEMLKLAAHPYCIFPTQGLEKVAAERSWCIYSGDDHLLIDELTSTIHGQK